MAGDLFRRSGEARGGRPTDQVTPDDGSSDGQGEAGAGRAPVRVKVLHRDARVVLVDKPAGLLVHRTELAPDRDVLLTRVRDALGVRLYPVHRLDRGTSGVVAFALDPDAARRLHEALEGREGSGRARKEYLALVRGRFEAACRVDYPVPRSEGGERVPAITSFEPVFVAPDGLASLVRARPETGRFHQIRRHLAHLRHPLAGDTAYGTGWFNRAFRARGLARLGLHARRLELPDPSADDPGARLVGVARVPPDLREALRSLGMDDEALEAT